MTGLRTWLDVQRHGARVLGEAGLEGAARDARLLLADALGVDAAGLIAVEMGPAAPGPTEAFMASLIRRETGWPISRIRGWREFYGRRFQITSDVLDPRPETELLVEQGLARLPPGGRLLDLGTGSGCILASVLVARGDATGVGVDISGAALAVAAANARELGVADRAEFRAGSWGDGGTGFDLVLANPPYVTEAEFSGLAVEVREHDPRLALVGGSDGLDPYRAILAELPNMLKPGGWLGVEFGAAQGEAVRALMVSAGLDEITVLPDLAGLPRAAFGRTPLEAS